MRELKYSTKKARQFIRHYRMSSVHSVFEFYKMPSQAKIDAYCKTMKYICHTEGYIVSSIRLWGNCQTFSIGYRLDDGTLVVITRDIEYHIKGVFPCR